MTGGPQRMTRPCPERCSGVHHSNGTGGGASGSNALQVPSTCIDKCYTTCTQESMWFHCIVLEKMSFENLTYAFWPLQIALF